MKKTVLLLPALLFFSIMVFSQEVTQDKVPLPVRQAFEKKFPAATDIKYELEKKNYEVSFKDKEAEMSASFSSTGKWLETETKITESDLPKKVMKSVAKNFKGYMMSGLATVETPSVKLCYEMDVKNDKQGYEVLISHKGDILRKTPLKKEKPGKPENDKK